VERRRKREAERKRAKRASETKDERVRRLLCISKAKAAAAADRRETSEQRKQRLRRGADANAAARARETTEQRKKRIQRVVASNVEALTKESVIDYKRRLIRAADAVADAKAGRVKVSRDNIYYPGELYPRIWNPISKTSERDPRQPEVPDVWTNAKSTVTVSNDLKNDRPTDRLNADAVTASVTVSNESLKVADEIDLGTYNNTETDDGYLDYYDYSADY
jgi:hypothetical protein